MVMNERTRPRMRYSIFINLMVCILVFPRCIQSEKQQIHDPNLSQDKTHPKWIYLTGGNDKDWLSQSEPGPRSHVASWADSSGNLWSFGGFGIDSVVATAGHNTNDLWYFNITDLQWTQVKPPMLNQTKEHAGPSIRQGAVACGVNGLVVVVFGGESTQGHFLDDTWIYEIKKNEWISLPNMPKQKDKNDVPPPRSNPVAWCLIDKLVIFGGLSQDGIILNDMWVFSMRTLLWTPVVVNKLFSTKPPPRTGSTSWVVGEKLYMFGGATLSNTPDKILQSDLWEFTIKTKRWSKVHSGKVENPDNVVDMGPVPNSRKFAQGWYEPIAERLYLFGGEGHPDSHMVSKRSVLFEEIWAYDLEIDRWTELPYYTAAIKSKDNSSISNGAVRTRGAAWHGSFDALYIFGGVSYEASNHLSLLNDVWLLLPPNVPLPRHIKETSLQILRSPNFGPTSHRSAGFIFMMCILSFGGVSLLVGAFFFLKKMSDYPRHAHPKTDFNVKYSKLARNDDDDDDHGNGVHIRKASPFRVTS